MMSFRKAHKIAVRAHEGQTDKLGVPYIEHVEAVAAGLAVLRDAEDLRIAGVLHDVVEDTDLTVEDLLKAGVPYSSVRIVEALTKVPGSTRVQQIERVIGEGYASCLVKLSDNAHNSRPDRLERLDGATRERLEGKYRDARKMIWDAAVRFNWGPDFFDNAKKIFGVVNPSLLGELDLFLKGGETYLSISFDYDCAGSTIRKRVEEARIRYPELDWDKPRVVKPTANFNEYVGMNDGKRGHRDTPIGSIIPGRKQSLRNR